MKAIFDVLFTAIKFAFNVSGGLVVVGCVAAVIFGIYVFSSRRNNAMVEAVSETPEQYNN